MIISIGTSGVVSAVAQVPAADPSGAVAGFADATGRYLPLVCTLNAARVLDATARLLGVDHDRLSQLALSAPAGSGGLVLVPYLEGERTPNRPLTPPAPLHGLRLDTATPAAPGPGGDRGAALRAGRRPRRPARPGGAGAPGDAGRRWRPLRRAVRAMAPAVLGCPVLVPPPGEYVADGAARQAAWVLAAARAGDSDGGAGGAGSDDARVPAPTWHVEGGQVFEADPVAGVRERYAEVRDLTASVPS